MSLTDYYERTDNDLNRYLRDLAQVSLLSREEEILLAKRIAGGDEQARQQFILANMRLVVNIAKSYPCQIASLEDLIHEGLFGLMRAVDHFNPERGLKFSTMATWWIKQAISRRLPELEQAIRLPVYANGDLRKLKKLVQSGREYTIEQLCELFGKPLEYIQALQNCLYKPASLEAPLLSSDRGDDEQSLADFLEDPASNSVQEQAEQGVVFSQVEQAINNLPPRLADVLRRRYGFYPYAEPQVLQEIADAWHITRERARQLEEKALKALKPYLLHLKEETAA